MSFCKSNSHLVILLAADVQPLSYPISLTPITLGQLSSQGMSAITSTASAPPTPIQRPLRPPPRFSQVSRIRLRTRRRRWPGSCKPRCWCPWRGPSPGYPRSVPGSSGHSGWCRGQQPDSKEFQITEFKLVLQWLRVITRALKYFIIFLTLGSPELMNSSMAVWAVASCMATLSGLR